jgi:tubulin polyglutamylase TTLL9
MKPVGRAQGKGIFLFSKLNEIIEWKKDTRFRELKDGEESREKYIVQLYVPNPLLVAGKKFDLRIYVLVTSYRPLNVWLYREGFARFSARQRTSFLSLPHPQHTHTRNHMHMQTRARACFHEGLGTTLRCKVEGLGD